MSADPYLAPIVAAARHREIKFDRSALRAPLRVPLPPSSPLPPPPLPLPFSTRLHLESKREQRERERERTFCRFRREARAVENGVARTYGVPHGHPPALPVWCPFPLPPYTGPTPYFIQFSFICHFPAAGYAPSGRAVQAGLLSSKPTPFYKYIARPSGPPRLCLVELSRARA